MKSPALDHAARKLNGLPGTFFSTVQAAACLGVGDADAGALLGQMERRGRSGAEVLGNGRMPPPLTTEGQEDRPSHQAILGSACTGLGGSDMTSDQESSEKEAAGRRIAADMAATRALTWALRYLSDIELTDLADKLMAEAEHNARVAERVVENASDDEAAQRARSLGHSLAFNNRRLSYMARHRDIVCGDPDEEPDNYGLFCAQCAVALNSDREHCPNCGTSDYVFVVDADRRGFPVIATKPTPEERDRFLQEWRDLRRSGAIDPSAPIGEIFRRQ